MRRRDATERRRDHAPPSRWEDFEDLCLKLWRQTLANVKKHGRSGQTQDGVDLYGRHRETQEWWGVQCKQRSGWPKASLSLEEINSEIRKAEAFDPPLSHFVIAATTVRDKRIQESVRLISTERQMKGQFTVDLFSWHDILDHFYGSPELYKDVLRTPESRHARIWRRVVLSIALAALVVLAVFLTAMDQSLKAFEQLNELAANIREDEDGQHFVTLDTPMTDSEFADRAKLIGGAQSIRGVKAERLYTISEISPLRSCDTLEQLSLVTLPRVWDLSPLASMGNLRRIDLWDLGQVRDLSFLSRLDSLEELSISSLGGIHDLTALRSLSKLRVLKLSSLNQVSDLRPLTSLEQLEHLELRFLSRVESLEPLAQLRNLRTLKLESMPGVSSLAPLESLAGLDVLELVALETVNDLAVLRRLTALRHLDVSLLNYVTDLSPLSKLHSLRTLVLWGLPRLSHIDDLQGLQGLRSFKIGRTPALLQSGMLQSLPRLEQVEVDYPVRLMSPHLLRNLPNFKTLVISGGRHLAVEEIPFFLANELGRGHTKDLFFVAPSVPDLSATEDQILRGSRTKTRRHLEMERSQ